MTFIYIANGTKLTAEVIYPTNSTLDYVGPFVFKNGSLSYIITSEGRFNTNAPFEYFIKDHLGNVRVTIMDDNADVWVEQINDYYAFGGQMASSVESYYKNPYLYNSKEKVEVTGWLDYGARMYDPALACWMTLDPLAEKYRRWSPYNYCMDNPLKYTDPDGMGPDPITSLKNITAGAAVVTTAVMLYTVKKVDEILTGSGDHTQKYGEPVTKPGGGADPTKNTAKITGPSIQLDDKSFFVFGLPGSSFKMPSGPLAPAKMTNIVTKAANEIIEQVSEDEPDNTSTSNTNNNEASSTTVDKPKVKVVSTWGSPDSSKVSIKKDSLSNGAVNYTRKDLNNDSETKSNKNEFQRAWNNW